MKRVARIVILGAGGRLGGALQRTYARDFSVRGYGHAELDLADEKKLRGELAGGDFDWLINAAALTNVDHCETHRDEAFVINATAPRILAEICRENGARFLHISTDYVFDGSQQTPYREADAARPISVYGESKLAGENETLAANPEALVARVSWVFGPDRASFIDNVLAKARETFEVAAVADKFSTPTYTLDLVEWLRRAWEEDLSGLIHLANDGVCSWQEYAQHALDCCRAGGRAMKAEKVGALQLSEMSNFVARRPVYTVLDCGKFRSATGLQMRGWRDAVADYIRNYYH